jgi:hypothetical protein
MRADQATAQDLAVTVRFGAVVKQQFGDTFVAAVGNGAAGCIPRLRAEYPARRLSLF